jgi:hypothetical protein
MHGLVDACARRKVPHLRCGVFRLAAFYLGNGAGRHGGDGLEVAGVADGTDARAAYLSVSESRKVERSEGK